MMLFWHFSMEAGGIEYGVLMCLAHAHAAQALLLLGAMQSTRACRRAM